MDCSPPGSSTQGMLEWAAMPSCRDLPNPGIKPESLVSPALAGGFFTTGVKWKAPSVRINIIQKIPNADKYVDKREPSCTVNGNVNWCHHPGKTVWTFLKNLERKIPYNSVMPLLGSYLKEKKSEPQRYTCTLLLTAALFTTAKTCKQPKCLSTDEQRKYGICVYMYVCIYVCVYIYVCVCVCVYDKILFSLKKGDPAICNNMDE